MKYIQLKNFNQENQNNTYYVTIADNTYIFRTRWSEYCDCGFLSISDYNNNTIVSGKALVNNLVIRNHNLPYTLFFIHLDDESYEPTLDTIADEFAIAYEDEDDGD